MTGKKLLIYTFLQWIMLVVLKIWVFNHQIFSLPGVQKLFFWLIILAVTAAVIRRFGIITFLEAFFIVGVWVIVDLFLDLLIVEAFASFSVFSKSEYWIGFGILIVSGILFHKKRHIAIRHGHRAY